MKKSLLSLAACAMLVGSANAAMYLVGEPAGNWSPQTGIEMQEADGGYKWTGTVGDNQWFAFATQLLDSDDWGTFNSTYRLNPPANGTVANFGEYTLTLGGQDCAFKGNGEEVTYFIKETDGVYTLSVTSASSEPEPVPETPLYIIGQVAGEWSPAIGIEMEPVAGGWKWSGNVADSDYFAFATELQDPDAIDWDVFNATCRISPDDGDGTFAADGVYGMHIGEPSGAFHGTGSESEVTYYVKESDGAYKLYVTGAGEAPYQPDDVWGVVGDFNNWGETPDFQMTKIGSGVWKATMYDFSGEFKFRANSDWILNYGPAEDGLIEADGVYDITATTANFIIPEEVEEVIFELDLNNKTLTVDGLTPSFLALRGNFIDWAFEWSYLFQEVDDDVYTLYLDGVGEDWRFKVADQDWKEFYTTGVTDMVAGEIYPLGDPNGPDMGVDNNYTDVTMVLNLDEGYFSFYGEVATKVALNEITTGKARYFNFQGVEVTNPSNGIYVRVINGKSEKVTVK